MNKNTLKRFISKYYLHGLNNSAVWTKAGDTLTVNVATSDKKLVTGVTWKQFPGGIDDADIGIEDTAKLLSLLKALPSDILSLDFRKDDEDSTSVIELTLSAGIVEAAYVTCRADEMDDAVKVNNMPRFDAAIILDEPFVKWFARSYAAMQDDATLFTVLMSERTKKLQVIVNYHATHLADMLISQPDTVDGYENVIAAPLNFSARHLLQILKSNGEFRSPVLNVSDGGLAGIAFSEDELDSEYYLVQVDTED